MMSNLINVEPVPQGDQVRHAGGGGLHQGERRRDPAAVPAEAVSAMATVSERQRELRNVACIVGVDESDEIGTLPNTSQLSLHLEAISNAVRDAGLKVKDVDGIFTAGQHSPATLGEALGVKPRYVDGTTVGGCSFIIMVGHAVAALHHGLCDVAVVSHGESGRSGTGVTRSRDTALSGQFEFPYGFGGATSYFGMITTRHMHEHGTTLEQWAQVAVSTRKWAALNPKARFRDPITVADVLNSRPVSYPFNLLNICLVTDAGGAVVLTRADRAKDCAKPPVYVRGFGEATEHVMVTQMDSLSISAATRLAGRARLLDGRRVRQGLQPHHALRRLHVGAADHAGVARLGQAGARAWSSSRRGAPPRAARCPSTPTGAGSPTPTPACTASSRSSRPPASSAASAARARCPARLLARQRHGRHALGRRHAGPRQPDLTRPAATRWGRRCSGAACRRAPWTGDPCPRCPPPGSPRRRRSCATGRRSR